MSQTKSQTRRSALLVLWLLVVVASHPAAAWETRRIDDHLPDWLSLSVVHRTRYENLGDQFRPKQPAGDVIALRTLVDAKVSPLPWLSVGAELEDSRTALTDDAVLTTGIVNALTLLRAYVQLDAPDVRGGKLRAQMGRMTMNLGSRRFVARNRFRNTINAFTGVDVDWKDEAGHELRAFWTMPVQRQPFDQPGLGDNDADFDEESPDFQFFGLYGATDLPRVGRGELFVLGMYEGPNWLERPTRNRRLGTPGFRVFRVPEAGHFDWQVETALQFGESRSSPASTRELTTFAHFHHVEGGYTFDARWSPRLALQYDYASGDKDPDDDENGRFDTQFGARRFDFGPTGIYGPFARANLNTPGIRVQLKPHDTVTSFVSARAFWLAEKRDTWATTGIRDRAGDSGSYVGSQVEARVRWRVLPGNTMLEVGYAHLFAGRFMKDAPTSPDNGDVDYGYVQIVLSL